MTISFKNQTITVIRPAWIVDRGDLVPDWDNATEHQISGCRVQPAAGDEVHGNRDAIANRWHLYAPPNADIDSLDRVRHQGVTYEVEGDIRRWPSPTGALANTQATLERWEG